MFLPTVTQICRSKPKIKLVRCDYLNFVLGLLWSPLISLVLVRHLFLIYKCLLLNTSSPEEICPSK